MGIGKENTGVVSQKQLDYWKPQMEKRSGIRHIAIIQRHEIGDGSASMSPLKVLDL